MVAKLSLPLVLAGIALGVSPASGAERFCVEYRSGALSCLYDDPGACEQEADRVGGVCAGNPDRLGAAPGHGAFCLAEGSAIICDRNDEPACRREARRAHGACLARWRP